MTNRDFNRIIWARYRKEGRHALAWRRTTDPYAILVSEIMLQQTQVSRAEGYYEKFLKRFPDVRFLAKASTADVLTTWQGLGYNRRAMFLKKTAQILLEKYAGKLPVDREALELLPGIGKGTSGSLMAFAFNKPEIFIETNIRRVLIHFFFKNRKMVTDKELERYIEGAIDKKRPREWYWALMDYGASMKASNDPKKFINPNRRSAHYTKQSSFAGSDRELRGKFLTIVLSKRKVSVAVLLKEVPIPKKRFEKVLAGLKKEGFIVMKHNNICINI